MSAGFTPGPWIAERRQHSSIVRQTAVSDIYSSRIAECPQWSPAPYPQPTPEDAYANARLIAAAPELYDLLFEIADTHGSWLCGDLGKRVRSLLAKARGEA